MRARTTAATAFAAVYRQLVVPTLEKVGFTGEWNQLGYPLGRDRVYVGFRRNGAGRVTVSFNGVIEGRGWGALYETIALTSAAHAQAQARALHHRIVNDALPKFARLSAEHTAQHIIPTGARTTNHLALLLTHLTERISTANPQTRLPTIAQIRTVIRGEHVTLHARVNGTPRRVAGHRFALLSLLRDLVGDNFLSETPLNWRALVACDRWYDWLATLAQRTPNRVSLALAHIDAFDLPDPPPPQLALVAGRVAHQIHADITHEANPKKTQQTHASAAPHKTYPRPTPRKTYSRQAFSPCLNAGRASSCKRGSGA